MYSEASAIFSHIADKYHKLSGGRCRAVRSVADRATLRREAADVGQVVTDYQTARRPNGPGEFGAGDGDRGRGMS